VKRPYLKNPSNPNLSQNLKAPSEFVVTNIDVYVVKISKLSCRGHYFIEGADLTDFEIY